MLDRSESLFGLIDFVATLYASQSRDALDCALEFLRLRPVLKTDGKKEEGPDTLRRALEQSQDVKAKAQAVAEDLGSHNEFVKQKIADGATMVSARKALASGAEAEVKVQECADDLDEVNGSLEVGIEDLKDINIELAAAQRTLARTKAALALAREEEKTARLRSLHDSATGLPNRELFDDRLEHAVSIAKRHDWTLAVMFLDLDGFKLVNDVHGHAAGDSVLKEVARRLLEHCRQEDSVCRNGGDEFLYYLMNPGAAGNIARIASDLARSIARPIDAGGLILSVKPSIGIAIYPEDGDAVEQLVRNADAAMYRAKRAKKGYAFFAPTGAEADLF